MRLICRQPSRAILRTPRGVVKQIVKNSPKKCKERATDRDQVIAEWLNWLCENGSVPDRC